MISDKVQLFIKVQRHNIFGIICYSAVWYKVSIVKKAILLRFVIDKYKMKWCVVATYGLGLS